ncbi:Swt1 family HEPN domain-containing protein [Gulosibacter molinativorax]|uniref:DUF499 domain-containing protein n=1 Tax=Gulosibacter molinativorax TaxID=256821 RepID=A0ABT7CDI7_9MICO|nr:Swt1 family HEPN domain-containing protein [Gulosibacter molinativorax]MDJ1372719.1 DUF499 domain-containing protein [Gulosibacter molinativorax]QUY62281.1 ATPase AAA [Gulosibacter molinativorax]
MAISNRERVGRALEQLSAGLEPFVEDTLRPHVPEGLDWTAILRVKDGETRAPRDYDPTDVQIQLRAVTERLGALGFVFNDRLSRAEQNLAGEMREVRNRWAHDNRPFSADDTYRALDTCERLLRAIGAPKQADVVRRMRVDAQRATYAEETRRDVRAASAAMPELADAELTPWREVLSPHPDIAEGNFARAEFAADLHQVAVGEASPEYGDPIQFFERTYLTEGLKTLLKMSAKRIAGDANAQSVVNLQTTFGGGKTHSMLAAWHLFSEEGLDAYPQQLQDLFSDKDSTAFDRAVHRVAIVGNEMAPGQPTIKPDGTVVNTIWGELAWQLGGTDGFAMVAEADRTGTNPGEALRTLIARYSPALILIDEWVAYARGLYGRDDLVGGTFDTQFTFAQQLTAAVQSVPGALLLVSIPSSDVRLDEPDAPTAGSELEIGGANGRAALQRLQHVVARVAHNWTPASSGESFEIVRRRLFTEPDAEGRRKIDATVRRFTEYYRGQVGELPTETRQVEYEARLRAAYPIHPELFDRLYGDWSTLERFQRTRGVLRLMSAVVHSLHASGDDSPLIMPGSLPLDDLAVRDEVTAYLDDAWRSIIETDIDGENAAPLQIDRERPLFGRRALTRRIARALFLGSAATLDSGHKGIERQRVFLGVAMPGDSLGNFGSALQMLADRATYLYSEGTRYWYDRQPSVNRMVAERAQAIDVEDVYSKAVSLLRGTTGTAPEFASVVLAPEATSDVTEAESVRLVVLHPRHSFASKGKDGPGREFAGELLRHRGSAARQFANTIVMLGADQNRWAEAEDALRQHIAWADIASSVRELDLTQSQAEHARRRESETRAVVDQRLTSAWIWATFPEQADGSQPATLTTMKVEGHEYRLAVRAGLRLGRDDVIYTNTSPLALWLVLNGHLRSRWNRGYISVGELWQYHLQYPYMPRLRDKDVLLGAIHAVMAEATWTERGFALADDYDEATGDFIGLRIPFESSSAGTVDDSTLLVAPRLAEEQVARERADAAANAQSTVAVGAAGPTGGTSAGSATTPRVGETSVRERQIVKNARYHGEIELNPGTDLRNQMMLLAEELLEHLRRAGPDKLEIRIEIDADKSSGFDDATVRTVRENGSQLGVYPNSFEDL